MLAALDDLPAFVGRRGRVWLSAQGNAWSAYWDEQDWLEQGPEDATEAEVRAWAAVRSDDLRVTATGGSP